MTAIATVTPIDAERLRDPRTEAWLDERYAAWTFDPALALDAVDQAGSLANQARLESLDDEVVDRYAADMDRGDTFPPVLARRRGKRKVLLLGGNHRFAAAVRLDRPTITAYVLDVADEMATRLMYEDNRRHGLPPSEAERIRQAIHLIDTGVTQEQAAEIVGVAAPKISVERSVHKAERRAAELKVPAHRFAALPKSSRYQLGLIRSDPVFERVATLAIDAGLTVEATRKLVVAVRDAASDAKAVEILDAETARLADDIGRSAGGTVRKQTARSKLLGAMAVVRSVSPPEVRAACTDRDQAVELAGWVERAAEDMLKIANLLRRR